MSEDKILRVAPVRDGAAIAYAWRFWSQGDEFYAAARDLVNIGKISFHRNGNWQLRAGKAMTRLAPGIKLPGGWTHALELVFLVGKGVLIPRSQQEEHVTQIETTAAQKLLIDLLICEPSRQPAPLPIGIRGTLLKALALRNGCVVHVVSRVMPLNESDNFAIADMRSKLRVNFDQRLPISNEMYAEASSISFNQNGGNVIQIIPVGSETFSLNKPSQDAIY